MVQNKQFNIPRHESIELLTFDGQFRGQIQFKEKIVPFNRTSDNTIYDFTRLRTTSHEFLREKPSVFVAISDQ